MTRRHYPYVVRLNITMTNFLYGHLQFLSLLISISGLSLCLRSAGPFYDRYLPTPRYRTSDDQLNPGRSFLVY